MVTDSHFFFFFAVGAVATVLALLALLFKKPAHRKSP